jgi:hypothetical protein
MGGSAWEKDTVTGQYYYHAFLREQPDLNWRNHDVRVAMHDVLRFWLDRGVDGFRVDVLWHLMKDPEFRDNPPNPAYQPNQPEIERFLQVHSADHPDVHRVVAEMRRVIDAYPNRVLIGEIYLPLERLVAYYGHEEMGGAHLPFNFQLLQTPWNARMIETVIQEYEGPIGCSATTTSRASPPVLALPKRASGRCSFSRCAAHRRCIMAMKSASLRSRFRLTACKTRGSATSRVWDWGAIPNARRCNGIARPTQDSPAPFPGCRCRRRRKPATSKRWARTTGRFYRYTGD